MDNEELDNILGITRCARCGHRLEGEVDCPFCAIFDQEHVCHDPHKWVYITACFLTSPFSIYPLIKTHRLSLPEKVFAFSGCLLWFGLYSALL